MNFFTSELPKVQTENLKILLNGCLELFKEHNNERYNRLKDHKAFSQMNIQLINEFKITVSETEMYKSEGQIRLGDKIICLVGIGKNEEVEDIENKIYLKFIKFFINEALCDIVYKTEGGV